MLSKVKNRVSSILSKFTQEEVDDTLTNVHVITIPVAFNVGKFSERHCNYLLKRNHNDTVRTFDVIGRLPNNEDEVLDNPIIKDIILPWSLFDSGITFEMLQEVAIGMPAAFYFNDRNFSWYGETMQNIRRSDDPYIKHLVKTIDTEDDKFIAFCAFVACLVILKPARKKTDLFDHIFPQYQYFSEHFKEMTIEFMIRGFVLPTPEESAESPITTEELSNAPVSEKSIQLSHEQKLEYVTKQLTLAGKDLAVQDKMVLLFSSLRLQGMRREDAVRSALSEYGQTDKRTVRSIVNAWTKHSGVLLFQVLPEALPLPDFIEYRTYENREKYISKIYNKLIKRS